ncbi:hypothetical protein OIU34_23180 [Pararhizobium sp. BT-229]|uniref:hypothetical protein n=1 Tax=Pararhizobium sp. BT-229 TaxID=2986923 RepID=UPI0021F6D273|nr:hypothetical protein [Pararhizobium sp. BT-229]MCV9964799.1 hypothetical protein [Pararhizobium sp. BT-229]
MNVEDRLRAKLEDWGIDFSDPGQTLWTNIQSHDDGCMTMIVLERVMDDPNDPAFRIYRAFDAGGIVAISIGGELSASGLEIVDCQIGEAEGRDWMVEIGRAVAGPQGNVKLSIIWAHVDGAMMSFIGRVSGHGPVRIVCGQCKAEPGGINVEIDFDRALEDVVWPRPTDPVIPPTLN